MPSRPVLTSWGVWSMTISGATNTATRPAQVFAQTVTANPWELGLYSASEVRARDEVAQAGVNAILDNANATEPKPEEKMDIAQEIKQEIVQKIEPPEWFIEKVMSRKRIAHPDWSSTTQHQWNWWTTRAGTLYRKLLMSVPVTDWFHVARVDFTNLQNLGLTENRFGYSIDALVHWLPTERLMAALPVRKGFTIDKSTLTGGDVRFRLRTRSATGKYSDRLGAVLGQLNYTRITTYAGSVFAEDINRFILDVAKLNDSFITLWRRAGGDSSVHEVKRHDTRDSFRKLFNERAGKFTQGPSISSLTIAPKGTLSSRPWGIEVESAGARGVDTPRGWDVKSDRSLQSAYGDVGEEHYIEPEDCEHYAASHALPDTDNWYIDPDDCDYCGLVRGDYDQSAVMRGDCREFVSPILHSFNSNGLRHLTEALSQNPQNNTAGVHVHVDTADLTVKQIGGVVFAYEFIEPLIETEYFRTKREYCKKRNTDQVHDLMKQTKNVKYKTYEDRNADYRNDATYDDYLEPGDRYVSLNLCSLSSHGTVEFRAMGPVYEYDHLVKWAHFCREMVNLAKANVPVKAWTSVRSFADVRALFAKYGSETSDTIFDSIVDDVNEPVYADV